MSFNHTCRGALGIYLAAPLRVPPPTPAPDPGPKEVGSGKTPCVEGPRTSGNPAST
jgi:hypothetical protein